MNIINKSDFSEAEHLLKKAIELKNDEELTIGKKKKNKINKGIFYMIRKDKKDDGIDIILNMTSVEKYIFKLLKDKISYEDNTVLFDTSILSNADKQRFSKGFKGLEKKNLIKRLNRSGSKNIFLFNPNFIIPNNYEKTIEKWKNE